MDNLETKHGLKLMIEADTKNMISYILLSLQYEIIEWGLKFVKFAKLSIGRLKFVPNCNFLSFVKFFKLVGFMQ